MDEVPATVRRRRELFAEIRCEMDRLSPYSAAVSIDMDEQEMRCVLDDIERVLEYAEVAKPAAAENDRSDEDRSL